MFKTIKRKMLASFCLLALLSTAVTSGVVSWKLRQSTQEQTAKLTADIIQQTYTTLNTHHQGLLRMLFEEVQRHAARIAESPNIRTALENRLTNDLSGFLEDVIKTEELDCALLLNLQMQVQASFPRNLDELALEQYILSWKFGQQAQGLIEKTGDAQRIPVSGAIRFEAEELKLCGITQPALLETGASGIAVAGIVYNGFNEPAGMYVAIKLLNGYTRPLQQVNALTESDSVLYLDATPIALAGFDDEQQTNRLDMTALQWSPAIREEILHANGYYNARLPFAGEYYYASCAALPSLTPDSPGILCVAEPEVKILKTQQAMSAYGRGTQQRVQQWIILIGIASLVLFALVSLWIATLLTTPLKQLCRLADAMTTGDLQHEVHIATDDEVGDLSRSLQKLEGSFREITKTAQAIAQGDLRYQVKPRSAEDELGQALQAMSAYLNKIAQMAAAIATGNLRQTITPESDHDVLNQSLQQMIAYIQEVAGVTEQIANNDLQVEITPKSDHDVLGYALVHMVTNLRETQALIQQSVAEVERQNWLATGEAELSNVMHGEQNLPTLGRNVITYLANYVQAQVGAIYVLKDDKCLHLVGSYAYTIRKGNRQTVLLGEGLIGQAALEQHPIVFVDVPADYLPVSSGLGETQPREIIVVPFLYEGHIKGVFELGSVHPFTPLQRSFLDKSTENIAIAIHSAQVRQKMQVLLEETQQQAEELQAQQEELQHTNQELAEQAESLRQSEEELQAQQEELRQTNEELAERTRALERQQKMLQEKNFELENARHLVEEKARELSVTSKYKSEFLANMSHELRTPLNSLLILSKLLMENKETNLTAKQVEFARTIHAAGTELLELINEVLDLSKVEAGKMALNIEAMSLKALGGYIEQNFLHLAEKKGLKLVVTFADHIPDTIRTDRQRVEQIIKNLLSNAVKFTEHGQVQVHFSCPPVRHGESARMLAIAVSDTGIGIPKDKQQVIFDAFQQVDGTTSRKYGGTGLGLSIVREFSRLLGGEIQVESEIGQGSTFTLVLPEEFRETESEPPLPVQAPAARRPAEPVRASILPPEPTITLPVTNVNDIRDDRHEPVLPTDKVLLIIEDDTKFAKILFDLARERGFKALIAGDGAAGLQLAYQYLPSAILLDVGLPGMDGWMVMEKLKANPETRHLPVHFISAQDQTHQALQMGAIGYLTKPVTLEQLHSAFRTVEEMISKHLKHLLIVENDEIMRLSMVELLGGRDVEITTAHSGEEAVQLLGSIRFDCMVLDLGLEEMSGLELLEHMAHDGQFAHLPVIVYTARELTKEEETRLKQYTESIIIKGAKSQDRLLDEVTLFLHRVEADLPEVQRKKLQRLHNKEAVLNGKTVLLVDDDMRNVFALSHVFEGKGIRVLVAEHGKEGLEMLSQHPEINVILMDMMMPEMDGYETISAIRSQPQYHALPIIALTAKAMKGDRQRCIDAGASDYLAKPVDPDKLLSLLRVWLY